MWDQSDNSDQKDTTFSVTTWVASPRLLLLPAPTCPLHLAPRPRTHAYQLLTTAPYTRGNRPSTSSTLALNARPARRALDPSLARRARIARPAQRTLHARLAPPRCAAPVSQRAALVSWRPFTLRPLAAEAYPLAESQYGSRAPDVLRPPPKTEKSARQHVKARKGVPQGKSDSVPPTPTFFEAHSALAHTSAKPRLGRTPPRVDSSTRGESSDSARGLVSTRTGAACPVRWRTREERLPDPPRVARAQSLRTLHTFDSLHASPARGVVVACMLARSVRGLRTRSQLTAPATLACSLCRLEALYAWTPRRAVSTRTHRFVSGLPFALRGFYHLEYML
ncbi:hypothetical protein C8J57DRAFT_1458240 [Mycena rebaudengoi]|nr:hypothetical protein C8J57DRAFT_1458240 [Mycena rebaudengoi]